MENHVFDCNSIVSYHMSAVRLLDTGMEAGSEWEKCLREIEGLYGQIPGDLRSPLLGDSLAGFTYPLCRPEWEMVREELDHTLENLETYIPLADREGAQMLDTLTEGVYAVLSRVQDMTGELAASYRKPETDRPDDTVLNYSDIKRWEYTEEETQAVLLAGLDNARYAMELSENEMVNARYTDPMNVSYYEADYERKKETVQRLEMQFRECFGYSREEFEEVLAKHNREKEAEFMEGDVFGGLLMETVSAPLVAIEGIQNQWRARTGRKTDYSFLEERDLTRSEVTAGMGSIGTALYLGAAEITSQLTLGVMTLGQDKVLAGAMGIMYMDAMQHRKEREGVDELKAADTALLTGMADYCLGRLGYGSISRCVEEGVRKSLVRKMGESFLTGAGMALGSETGGQLIDWMLNGRLSEWGKIYNAHLDEGMSETEAFGEMVKDVGPELTVHTVAGGISGAGFAVIHMLAASKDNRLRKQETIEKTNQEGERNRNETSYGKSSGKYDTTADFLTNIESGSDSVKNWKGQEVKVPDGHIMSPRDPSFSAKPITEAGPYTLAQRDAFLAGNSAGTKLAPHHRHQIPVRDGGVIDELPGPGHPSGNQHTAGSPSRHPAKSIFNSERSGNVLRANEITQHWIDKGNRLIEVEPGVWIDPGF